MPVAGTDLDLEPTLTVALMAAGGGASTLLSLMSYMGPEMGPAPPCWLYLAVIVASPSALAVTKPFFASTVATAVLLDSQVTFWSVAVEGMKFSANEPEPPTVMDSSFLFKYARSASLGASTTLMRQLAVLPPFCVIAVIVAVPTLLGVTTPFALTVAMALSLDDHATFLLVTFWGEMAGIRVPVASPTARVIELRLSVRPATAMGGSAGVDFAPPQER